MNTKQYSKPFSRWCGSTWFDYATKPEYKALLRAICEQPFDDLPRMILADWLEEYGTTEATEKASSIREPARVGQLVSPVSPGGSAMCVSRGFVSMVRCTRLFFEEHAAKLVVQHPIERWEIIDAEPHRVLDGLYYWSVFNYWRLFQWATYTTREDAIADLNRACFHIARERAGLPRINQHTPTNLP
jgi:uncharacterized protein (TIGR02996 family)